MNYISFPNLFGGIKLNVPTGIDITDNFSLKFYGVIICFGYILCTILALRSCKKYGIEKDDLTDYILLSIPAAVIGARIYYVIFEWEQYKDNLLDIFKVWHGGLAIYGGVILVVVSIIVLTIIKNKKRVKNDLPKINALSIIDFSLPYVCLGQAIGRWGNFFNQEAYGAATSSDFFLGMTGNRIAQEMGDNLVHPTFLYESLWCFAAFAVMMVLRKHFRNPGEMTSWYCILYGVERALVEGLRTDSLYISGTNVRVSQVSIVLAVCGIVALIIIRQRAKKKAMEEAASGRDDSISRLVDEMEQAEQETEKSEEKEETEDTEKAEETETEEEKTETEE